jgi:hypothetical protein
MRAWWVVATGIVFACGGNKPSGFGDGGSDGQVADSPFNNGDGAIFGDSGSGDGNTNGCSDAAKLVYVVSDDGVLHSFNPATLQFTTIGTINCPNNFAQPNSMAVSRDAVAYVNMSDGTLWKVSTADASCSATGYQLGQQSRRIRGMGFSTDSAQGTTETLYTCTANDQTFTGGGLASISIPGFKLTPIGDYTSGLAGNECELTGTGNAELFGFFATISPPKLAQITKTSGATPSPITLTGVNTTLSYAFSFWGGDFWFYTQGNGVGSTVTHYKYATDKSYSDAVQDTGFVIVGAGVSTCAPTTPPN